MKQELLAASDYVSLHCPLPPETEHWIDKTALVDEQALIEALKQGRIGGAALDVQETEAPAENSPLISWITYCSPRTLGGRA